ncbi:MAG TPA: RnfH family protein [Candidatus Pseudomonas excrementavium]|uniref:RnfH family protein n=1 Tax=Halopseudomonas bauzanensis TaxID=653930 RepID=UPI001C3B9C0E|nr:RnfH family protein [Halopseudomonas bauzanensis]HIZ51182.1 RnfH family protein [Candidatus Pseudomonas excrementavium]
MNEPAITVEVAYALPDQQRIIRLAVPAGTTVLEAARLSGIAEHFPGLDLNACDMGVFGKLVAKPAERVLRADERVELYRPLIADPKEVRKQRAARAKDAIRAD